MDKVSRFIPLSIFCLYFGKLFFTPVTYANSSILLILGAVVCFYESKLSGKQSEAIQASIAELRKDLNDKQKEIDSLKGSVAGMKLGSTLRPQNVVR